MKRIVRQHVRKAVLVTLKTGDAFRGVLFDADSDAIVLRSCTVADANGTDRTDAPVDGELLILRPDISFMQFL